MAHGSESFVHFKNAQVFGASNDGMELLGHFLLTQVGAEGTFFTKWLENPKDASISSGSYYLEKKGDNVYLSHLENPAVKPFDTTREWMLDLIKRFESNCKSDGCSACQVGGKDLLIRRSPEGDFHFDQLG